MKREAMNHTKMKRLCRRMDIPLYVGVGLMESLWHLTAREAPRGDIGRLSDEDIALAIDYRGDETKLIEALVSAGWLDQSADFRLLVHDWWDHADDAVHMRICRLRIYFADGKQPKYTRLPKVEREEAQAFYDSCAQNQEPCALEEVCARTGNRQPVTSNQQPAPAVEVPISISDRSTPATLAAAREKFPATDAHMAQKIAKAARKVLPDAKDSEIADAVRISAPQAKDSAAFFVHTVPRIIESVRARSPDPAKSEAEENAAFERARELWRNSKTPEQRAEVEAVWPALRSGGTDEKHAS